jgi:EpsI family protein
VSAQRLAALAAAVLLGAGTAAGEWLRPTVVLADLKPRIDLEHDIPPRFGSWHAVDGFAPVLPDPTVQQVLDKLYSQVLSRTYVDARGRHVMLSVAYGADQASESTAAHRPEFCYRASGFAVGAATDVTLAVGTRALPLRRMAATLERRHEPISYWVTLDETATLPGLGRKLAQLRYGLSGRIADGMLVRVSTINDDDAAAYATQEDFLRELYAQMDEAVRGRYFGGGGGD